MLEGTEAFVHGAEAWSGSKVHGHGVGPVPELVRWVPARAFDAEEPKMAENRNGIRQIDKHENEHRSQPK